MELHTWSRLKSVAMIPLEPLPPLKYQTWTKIIVAPTPTSSKQTCSVHSTLVRKDFRYCRSCECTWRATSQLEFTNALMRGAKKASKCLSICSTTWWLTKRKQPRNSSALFLAAPSNTFRSGFCVTTRRLIRTSSSSTAIMKAVTRSTTPDPTWRFIWGNTLELGHFTASCAANNLSQSGTWTSIITKSVRFWEREIIRRLKIWANSMNKLTLRRTYRLRLTCG